MPANVGSVSDLGGLAANRENATRSASLPSNEAEAAEIIGKLEKYLDVSKGEITRLDYIVTQFLQAIRPSAPQLRQASLNDVVKETVDLLRPEIENRGVTTKVRLARQLPSSPLDVAQIKQALVNLIKKRVNRLEDLA